MPWVLSFSVQTIYNLSYFWLPLSFFKFIFNWRIIALYCCIGFCCTTMQISHNHVYIPALGGLPSAAPASHPSRLSQSTAPGWTPCVTEEHRLLLQSSFSALKNFYQESTQYLNQAVVFANKLALYRWSRSLTFFLLSYFVSFPSSSTLKETPPKCPPQAWHFQRASSQSFWKADLWASNTAAKAAFLCAKALLKS